MSNGNSWLNVGSSFRKQDAPEVPQPPKKRHKKDKKKRKKEKKASRESSKDLETLYLPDGSKILTRSTEEVLFQHDRVGDPWSLGVDQQEKAPDYHLDRSFRFLGCEKSRSKRLVAHVREESKRGRVKLVLEGDEKDDWQQGIHRNRYFSTQFFQEVAGNRSARRLNPKRARAEKTAFLPGLQESQTERKPPSQLPTFLPLKPLVSQDSARSAEDAKTQLVDPDLEEHGQSEEDMFRDKVAALNRSARALPEADGDVGKFVQQKLCAYLELARLQIRSFESGLSTSRHILSSPWQRRPPRLRSADQERALLQTQRAVLWRAIGDLKRLEREAPAYALHVTLVLPILYLRGLHAEAWYGGAARETKSSPDDDTDDSDAVFTWTTAVAANQSSVYLKRLSCVTALRGPWSELRGTAFTHEKLRGVASKHLLGFAEEVNMGLEEHVEAYLHALREITRIESACGFHERIVAVYQALLEGHFAKMNARDLEEFWEAEASRIGDAKISEQGDQPDGAQGYHLERVDTTGGAENDGHALRARSELRRSADTSRSASGKSDAQRRNDAIEEAYVEATRLMETQIRVEDAENTVENAELLDFLEHGVQDDAPTARPVEERAAKQLDPRLVEEADRDSQQEYKKGTRSGTSNTKTLALGSGFGSQTRDGTGFWVYSTTHRRRIFISEADALRSIGDLYRRTLDLTMQRRGTQGAEKSVGASFDTDLGSSTKKKRSKLDFGMVNQEAQVRNNVNKRMRQAEKKCLFIPLKEPIHQDPYFRWGKEETVASERSVVPVRFRVDARVAEENPEAVILYEDIQTYVDANEKTVHNGSSTIGVVLTVCLARELLRHLGLTAPRGTVHTVLPAGSKLVMWSGGANLSRPPLASDFLSARMLWETLFVSDVSTSRWTAARSDPRSFLSDLLVQLARCDQPLQFSFSARIERFDGSVRRIAFLRDILHHLLRRLRSADDEDGSATIRAWKAAAAAEIGCLLILFEANVCAANLDSTDAPASAAETMTLAQARSVCQRLLSGGLDFGLDSTAGNDNAAASGYGLNSVWNAYIYAEDLWGDRKEAFRIGRRLYDNDVRTRESETSLSISQMELRYIMFRLQIGLPLAASPTAIANASAYAIGQHRAKLAPFEGDFQDRSGGGWRRRMGLQYLFNIMGFEFHFEFETMSCLDSEKGLFHKKAKLLGSNEKLRALAEVNSDAFRGVCDEFWNTKHDISRAICEDLIRVHRCEASKLGLASGWASGFGVNAFDKTTGHFFVLASVLWATYLVHVDKNPPSGETRLPSTKDSLTSLSSDAPMEAATKMFVEVLGQLEPHIGRASRLEGAGAWAATLGSAFKGERGFVWMRSALGDDASAVSVERFLRVYMELVVLHMKARATSSPKYLQLAQRTLRRLSPRDPCALFSLGLQDSTLVTAPWDRPLGFGGATLEEACVGLIRACRLANAELVSQLSGWDEGSGVARVPQVGAMHWRRTGADRVRKAFEDVLAVNECQNCPFLWRYYVAFEVARGRYASARRLYFRAVYKCPWSKQVWMDAFRCFADGVPSGLRRLFRGDELEDIQKAMEDRGLCLREELNVEHDAA